MKNQRAEPTIFFNIKIRKTSIFWCHYKFISCRDDHHHMLKEEIIWVY